MQPHVNLRQNLDLDREVLAIRPTNRVILVESCVLLRESLGYLLQHSLAPMSVEACASINDIQPGSVRLVIIGPSLVESSSNALQELLSAVQQICRRAPVGAILRGGGDHKLRDLQPFGLTGVVQDNAGTEIVVAAIKLMISGASCFPREHLPAIGLAGANDPILRVADVAPSAPARPQRPESALTLRESQILSRLRQGTRNKIIAVDLGISESTVKVHVRSILKKLNATNRTQVALGIVRTDGG